MGPVLIIVTAVAAAGAAIYFGFNQIRDAASGMSSATGSAMASIRRATVDAFGTVIGWATSAFNYVANIFREIGAVVGDSIRGAMDAITAGDFNLAGEIALTGLQAVYRRGLIEVKKIWFEAKAAMVDFALASYARIVSGFGTMAASIRRAWNDAMLVVRTLIFQTMDAVLSVFASGITKVFNGIAALADFAQKNLKITIIDPSAVRAAGIAVANLGKIGQVGSNALFEQNEQQIKAFEDRVATHAASINAMREALSEKFDAGAAASLATTEQEYRDLVERLAELKEQADGLAKARERQSKQQLPEPSDLAPLDKAAEKLKSAVSFGTVSFKNLMQNPQVVSAGERTAKAAERTAKASEKTTTLLERNLSFS